jgi:hypothetical protein
LSRRCSPDVRRTVTLRLAARVGEHVGARELSVLTGVPASTTGAVPRRAGSPHLAQLYLVLVVPSGLESESNRGPRSIDTDRAAATSPTAWGGG